MKHLYYILTLVIVLAMCSVAAVAQTTSDCAGAISVCEGFYEETSAPLNTGNVNDIVVSSCNFGEFNSVWYVFTVQEDGLLSFILDPAEDNSDYDWSLFDITANGCAGVDDGSSPEVSCNSWGVIGVNGPTGISTAQGGTGNSNGPGDLNGPPFNADLPVTAGTTFALAVMNWSSSPDGYTLDFGESTASIFDDDPPFLVSATPNCSGSELTVVFSENIIVSTMDLEDFTITGPGGSYAIGAIEPASGAVTSDHTFLFSLGTPLTDSGSYTLVLEEGAEFVEDACGNTATGTFNFEVSGLMSFDFTTTAACNGAGGVIEITSSSGGTDPVVFSLDGTDQADLIFDGLEPDVYVVAMTDATGCELALNVIVDNFELTVDAGSDQNPCEMGTFLEGDFNGGEFEWIVPDGITVSDSSDPATFVTADSEGTYTLVATATLGTCFVEAAMNITLSVPLNPMISVQDVSCHGFCDGVVTVSSNAGSLTATLGGIPSGGEEFEYADLCFGSYELTLQNFAGCVYTDEISITQPPEIVANFSATPQPAEVPETEITFFNESLNDSTVHWLFGNPALGESEEDNPVFEFPQGAGGIYEVTLIATDIYGCTDEVTGQILIEDNFMVFAPNAFSPDNDGINDVFGITFSYDPLEYRLLIFDRWGEPVFQSTDFRQVWMGNMAGGTHYVQNGVYTWVLEVRGNEPDIRNYTGTVTVVR